MSQRAARCPALELPAQCLARATRRQRHRREGPRRRGVDEDLPAAHEVDRHRAARIHTASWTVQIDTAHGDVPNAAAEVPEGKRQPPRGVFAQRVDDIGDRVSRITMSIGNSMDVPIPARARNGPWGMRQIARQTAGDRPRCLQNEMIALRVKGRGLRWAMPTPYHDAVSLRKARREIGIRANQAFLRGTRIR